MESPSKPGYYMAMIDNIWEPVRVREIVSNYHRKKYRLVMERIGYFRRFEFKSTPVKAWGGEIIVTTKEKT